MNGCNIYLQRACVCKRNLWSQSMCGGQRTNLGAAPRLPPCLRQGLATAHSRLAGLPAAVECQPRSLVYYKSTEITDVLLCLYMGFRDLNSGPHICIVCSFQHRKPFSQHLSMFHHGTST